MSRSEKEKMFRRNLLSDTAARLFKSKSYHSIKVEDITSEADFSKGSFYRYFYNKDELVFEIIFNEISRLNEALEKTCSGAREYFFTVPQTLQRLCYYFTAIQCTCCL
jgi:AcrR family transcriptional regulator